MTLGKVRKLKRQQGQIDKPVMRQPDSGNRASAFPWWLIAALCIAAFLAYARSLSYDFVFDDDSQVLRNPWIRDWSHVWQFFFKDVWSFRSNQPGNYYRPLHMLAHAAGYTISGLKPFGYHLINILLHCLSTLLVALFGYRLTRDKSCSAAGGFIFALHPVHTESVSWIAGIPDLLCAVFYFGSLYIYSNQDPSREKRNVLLSALLFLGALFAKEMAFTLPLMAIWMDLCINRKLRWSRYAALAVSFGIYAALRIHSLSRFQIRYSTIELDFHGWLLNLVTLLGEYLAKAFVPFNINPHHVFHPVFSLVDTRFLLSVLAILAFGFAAWRFRRERGLLFLIGFIPIAVIPVLNIAGIGLYVFADRYLYLPSLGSCLLIPLLAQKAVRMKCLNIGASELKITLGLAGAACIVFAFMLNRTVYIWRDNLTLYSETLKRSPDSDLMASNLSNYYYKRGQMKEAEEWGIKAEKNWMRSYMKPPQMLADIYVRQAFIYLDAMKSPEALEYLEKAAQINPNDPKMLHGRAKLYVQEGNFSEALKACEAALEVFPRNEMMHNNLAIILIFNGEIDKAIEHARTAIEIYPKYGDAYLSLARGYAIKGWIEQAKEAYNTAKLLNPALQPDIDRELSLLK
jgi:protein O-mannosyl-transferase